MRRVAVAAENYEKIGCTITGGTDSRAILAHMRHNEQRPVLDITGDPEHVDVTIARKIANAVDSELLFVSDAPEEEKWLEEAICAADGMTGVCGIYRLYKKAKRLHQEGIPLELGGAAGEIYKNSFLNQDYPFYKGQPRWERFLHYKVATYDFPMTICGERIYEKMEALPGNTLTWLRQHTGKTKARAYLSAGYEILQGRMAAVNSMNHQWYIAYAPLMERRVVAMAFRENPYALEMQAFQRRQVSNFCPEIKDIETDRGLTCDIDKKTQEYFKSMLFLVQVALGRILRRRRNPGRVDTCFTQGLTSPQFHAALERCKKLDIIASDVSPDQIPNSIADRIFAIGTML